MEKLLGHAPRRQCSPQMPLISTHIQHHDREERGRVQKEGEGIRRENKEQESDQFMQIYRGGFRPELSY